MTFGGRRLLVEDDPCMLPSPLCGIFSYTLTIASKKNVHTLPPPSFKLMVSNYLFPSGMTYRSISMCLDLDLKAAPSL